MDFSFVEFSNPGPYAQNQDAVAHLTLPDGSGIAICVADGVGGENRGEVASQFAVTSFMRYMARGVLPSAQVLKDINDELLAHTEQLGLPPRVYTTFTGVHVSPTGWVVGVHVGDCRALVLRNLGIQQLTEDHTEAHRFIREGKLSREDFANYPRKHVLESALGMAPPSIIQEFRFQLAKRDRLILITDGIHNKVSKREIRDLSLERNNIQDLAKILFEHTTESRPDDNFTFAGLEAH